MRHEPMGIPEPKPTRRSEIESLKSELNSAMGIVNSIRKRLQQIDMEKKRQTKRIERAKQGAQQMTITKNTNNTYTAAERTPDGRLMLAESETRTGAMIEMYHMILARRLKVERMA